MADTKISGLTTDATPHRTNDFAPTYDASAVATKKVALKDFGPMLLHGGFASTSPSDATTYYFGPFQHLAMTTSDSSYIWTIPRAGIITRVALRLMLSGAGSSETSTLSLRINSTTDTTLTSALVVNANVWAVYTPSISVALGESLIAKWVTPTWATNPTGITASMIIFLE